MKNVKYGGKGVSDVIEEGMIKASDPELLCPFDMTGEKVIPELQDPSRVKLNQDKLRLSGDGLYYSLQGEGMTMGQPAVFIRLHVCNLRCAWCDTCYTWSPHSREFWTESYEMNVQDIASKADSIWTANDQDVQKRLIVTGGEPLLQKRLLDDLVQLMSEWKIEIETNGTVMPTDLQLETCQFNCSPKLANSENPQALRVRPAVLQAINKAHSQFKFVVMAVSDIDEIKEIFLPHISRDKVILMPQGTTTDEVNENARRVVGSALSSGFRLLTRLHVDIWGARRKV